MHNLKDGEFDLTIYVPTKGRPKNAIRLQEQFYKTTRLNSRIVFIISDNDQKRNHYTELDETILVSPNKAGFVDPLNMGYLVDRRKVYSYAVGFMGDDHMPRTDGWDEIFINNLIDLESGFVYGRDGLQDAAIPTYIVMTSNIPLTLGFMTLPELMHLYADNFWLDLGSSINRIKYVPEVYIEHMHPAVGKSFSDAGYVFSGDSALDQRDRAVYQNYIHNDLEGHTRILNNMIRRASI
jgi:hypothetical protein